MESIKHFCELPSLENCQDYLTWHLDPRLARYLQGLEDRSQEQIAQILVSRILANPTDKLACTCITAILAHILFSASGRARLRTKIFDPLQHHHSTQFELEDIYQIALDIICQPTHFLANFQPDPANWYGSLVRYSNCRFDRLLIDRIRNLPGMSGFKRTNLGLLARASRRRMETALTNQGERDLRLQQLLLLHQCLVDVVKAGEFDTRNPQPMHYDNLLARYKEQCEIVELAIVDHTTLIQLVEYMGKIIRNYLQPQQDSLDGSIGNNDADGTALIDLIPDPSHHPQQLESDILNQDVIELVGKLAINDDRLLMFFFGLELTQVEVGVELDCHQTTAKHRRDRCLKQLAKHIHAKIFQTTDLSIELLNSIIDQMKLACNDLYTKSLLKALDLIVADPNLNQSNIADLFIDRIQQQWQFNFKPAQVGLTKATAFVALSSSEN